jgi:hypothetical protein
MSGKNPHAGAPDNLEKMRLAHKMGRRALLINRKGLRKISVKILF